MQAPYIMLCYKRPPKNVFSKFFTLNEFQCRFNLPQPKNCSLVRFKVNFFVDQILSSNRENALLDKNASFKTVVTSIKGSNPLIAVMGGNIIFARHGLCLKLFIWAGD